MVYVEPLNNSSPCALSHVLSGQVFDKPPVWFMRQAGRYLPEYRQVRSNFSSFKEYIFSVPEVVEVTLQPLKRFDLDAAIIFSDILTVPLIVGQDFDIVESKGPRLNPLKSPDEIYELANQVDYSVCDPVYQALTQVRSQLDQSKDLIGFAGAPWTLASYMLEGQTSKTFSLIKTFAYQHPKAFEGLLDLLSEVIAQHLIFQIKAGASVVKIFDSWASAVPAHKISEWIIQPHKKIVDRVKKAYPTVPIIGFPRGMGYELADYVKQTGIDGLGIGQATDIRIVRQHLPTTPLQGNIDPQLLVAGGQSLVDETKRLIDLMAGTPYIFNLGHGVVPQTPIENVDLVLNTIKGHASR